MKSCYCGIKWGGIPQSNHLKRASLLRGPWFPITLTLIPSGMILPSFSNWAYSCLVYLVKPNFLETAIFWRPGNLNLDLLRASLAWGRSLAWHLMEMRMVPMATLAHLPTGLPKAPLMPVWSLSAPAHESILLILRTCQGWTLVLMWKASLPALLVMYLLQAILAASRASDETYSFSPETRWIQQGNSLYAAFFLPMSYILIFESGTPLQYLDFGYGLPFWYL